MNIVQLQLCCTMCVVINVMEGTELELDIKNVVFIFSEIKAVAALLGVSGVSLYRGFTTRTRNTRGQVFKSLADAASVSLLFSLFISPFFFLSFVLLFFPWYFL